MEAIITTSKDVVGWWDDEVEEARKLTGRK
jgi:hypothetical protein